MVHEPVRADAAGQSHTDVFGTPALVEHVERVNDDELAVLTS